MGGLFGGGGYDNSQQLAEERKRREKIERQEQRDKERNERTRDAAAKKQFGKRGKSLLRNNLTGIPETNGNNSSL